MNRRLLPLAVVAVLIAFFAVILLRGHDSAPAQTMRQLQPITAQSITGEVVSLFGNGVTIVNVFASWCVPCVAEHPNLKILKQRSDVRMVGINYKDKAADRTAYLNKLGNPYDAVLADSGDIATQLAITGVPETFVIDKDGFIRLHLYGPIEADGVDDIVRVVEKWR